MSHAIFRKSLLTGALLVLAGNAAADITLYESEEFRGRSMNVQSQVQNLEATGFNDRVSSVVIGRGRYEVCEDAYFQGRCVVLRSGRYDSLASIGLNNQISSVRAVGNKSPNYQSNAPVVSGQGAYLAGQPEYRRRPDERLFEAPVTSVRAVVGPPEQRCWIEQERVVQNSPNVNVPGAIVGAVIGGVLGHQIGGGRGQDIATAGGAVGGAALGANIGTGGGQQVGTRDVQRCSTVSNARPAFWDVTYNFRGAEHRVQTTASPGPTILVNAAGEPRV